MIGNQSSSRVHPTAVIDKAVRLHESVEVGPYCVIGAGVEVGEGTAIGAHAVLKGPMRIGRNNKIFSFAVLGEVSQDKTADVGDDTRLEIGDGNTIREFVTIQRGTLKDKGVTRIGNDNWIMNYVHIAHDCNVGNHVVFANNSTLAGHVWVEDHAVLGGATLVAQYCRLGAHCFTAGGAGVTRDVPPFVVVQGNPAMARGINVHGIKRRGFNADQMQQIKQAYRTLFLADLKPEAALEKLATQAEAGELTRQMYEFVRISKQIVGR